ncbi:MAG: hypothetical protein H6707_11105 [Deltaproteobacteria bacterium]|nr:hypothetical protein [Deltaproteobacteria bacterium]
MKRSAQSSARLILLGTALLLLSGGSATASVERVSLPVLVVAPVQDAQGRLSSQEVRALSDHLRQRLADGARYAIRALDFSTMREGPIERLLATNLVRKDGRCVLVAKLYRFDEIVSAQQITALPTACAGAQLRVAAEQVAAALKLGQFDQTPKRKRSGFAQKAQLGGKTLLVQRALAPKETVKR